MKFFVVGSTPVTYHPKDDNGVKLMNVDAHAILLHVIKNSLRGFETDSIFVGEDMDLNLAIQNSLGKNVADYPFWLVNIEYSSKGYVDNFEAIKRFRSLSDVEEALTGKKPVLHGSI